jgi:endonuclease/exonuclease/phosphatase family metal-dependent hydrolase
VAADRIGQHAAHSARSGGSRAFRSRARDDHSPRVLLERPSRGADRAPARAAFGTNRETAAGETEGPYRRQARPESAIVCGDFNLPPEDPLHARFAEAFPTGTPKFVDAWLALHPGKSHPHTFRVHERKVGQSPYCCDFVFVTEDLAPRLRTITVDGANQASDHQPVSVELG